MNLQPASKYLVCGASSGIGLALVFQSLQVEQAGHVFATHRTSSDLGPLKELKAKFPDKLTLIPMEASQESDYAQLAIQIGKQTDSLDYIFNAIGILHDQSRDLNPERQITDVTTTDFTTSMQINTLPTLLLAKYLKDFIRKAEAPVFMSISAKVGSIDDNRMGGWYSYRMSKAALNMAIKNLSIEFGRRQPAALFIALHPGTTTTKLSEPFMAGAQKKYKIHTPHETAANLMQVISSLTPEKDSGGFFSWDGSSLPF